MPDSRKYTDRADYLKMAVAKRRKTLRQRLIDIYGGECKLCGYDKCTNALDFHHVDATTKVFGLSAKGLSHGWQKLLDEASKCILVCANCHREIHAGIIKLQPDWVTKR